MSIDVFYMEVSHFFNVDITDREKVLRNLFVVYQALTNFMDSFSKEKCKFVKIAHICTDVKFL